MAFDEMQISSYFANKQTIKTFKSVIKITVNYFNCICFYPPKNELNAPDLQFAWKINEASTCHLWQLAWQNVPKKDC